MLSSAAITVPAVIALGGLNIRLLDHGGERLLTHARGSRPFSSSERRLITLSVIGFSTRYCCLSYLR